MAQEPRPYYQFESPRFAETAVAWIVVAVVVIDAVVFGFLAWNGWKTAKESRRVFALLEASAGACRADEAAGAASRYEHAAWKVSFELPAGHFASETVLSQDDDVELRVSRRPAAGDEAAANVLYDTSVRVTIGPERGFSRYYARPFSGYSGYRRFTAVGRAAVGYTDPQGEADSVQVIAIDDTRNGREIVVTYTAIEEGAEALALGIIETMRLAVRERQEVAVKPGWKIFSQDPLRFQYPEDYRVTTPNVGRIEISGAGGRIEISSAYDIDETGRRTSLGAAATGAPDDLFLLQYGVDLRVSFYYAPNATEYDRSVLKDIGGTISLNK
jgi:hypothetical protein